LESLKSRYFSKNREHRYYTEKLKGEVRENEDIKI
jgi:hypothetical protein